MSKKKFLNKKGMRGSNNTEPKVININVATTDHDRQEKKSFFQKWFRWDRLSAIAAIISAIVALIMVLPPIGKARAIASINKSIEQIEQNFHPENISISYSSSPDIQMVKDFQIRSLNLVTYWKVVRDMKPASYFKDFDSEDICSAIKSHCKNIENLNHEVLEVFKKVYAIQNYGLSHNIPLYDANQARIVVLFDKIEKLDTSTTTLSENILKRFEKLQMKYGNIDFKDLPSKKLLPILKDVNKTYKLDDYEFIDEVFQFLVEQNSMFMTYLNTKR